MLRYEYHSRQLGWRRTAARPCWMAILWTLAGGVVNVQADPAGTDYFLALDAIVVSGGGETIEGYSGILPFDSQTDPLRSDTQLNPPFSPAGELNISESVRRLNGHDEEIRILISALPGGSLFANTLAPGGSVFVGVGDLYWPGEHPSVSVAGVRVSVDRGAGFQEITPRLMDVLGQGTEVDPLAVELEVGALVFGPSAQALNLEIQLVVPEPRSLVLALLALFSVAPGWSRQWAIRLRHRGKGPTRASIKQRAGDT